MLITINIVGVVFVMIALGYLAVIKNIISNKEVKGIGKYALNFALPAMIFNTVSQRSFDEVFDLAYLGAYLGGSVIVFIIGFFICTSLWKGAQIDAAFQGLAVSCSNSGFIGYPILLLALPSVASLALAHNLIIENFVLIPLGLILIEKANNGQVAGVQLLKTLLLRLVHNPLLIAIVLGLACSLLKIQLPLIIKEPVSMLAASSVAASLVFIGGSIAGLSLKAIDWKVVFNVVGKLFLHPLAVILCIFILGLFGIGFDNEEMMAAAIIFAATPVMTVYPILAQKYGHGEAMASLSLFVMTVLSFFTLTMVLWMQKDIVNVLGGAG